MNPIDNIMASMNPNNIATPVSLQGTYTSINPQNIYSAYMYSYPHKTAYRKLTNVHFSDYRGLLSQFGGSLYFHVPFCASKCGYCNLFSVTGQNDDVMEAYITACETQVRQYDIDVKWFDSLIVGGGDPSILPAKLLYRLLSMAGGGSTHEVCIEVSPNEVTVEKLSILKSFNTTRVSIGIQSFVDSELVILKRLHSADSAVRALELLQAADFPCLNLDLIYGIPGQTLKSLEYSIRQALEFAPDEIFIYPLYIRKGTKIDGKAVNSNAYAMYNFARDYLVSQGYTQASMRKFIQRRLGTTGAVSTPESIPEVVAGQTGYNCGFENVLAIGCGGRSYLGNLHYCHPYDIKKRECLDIIDSFIKTCDKTTIEHGYILNQDELKRRYIIKNLLYHAGISLEEYEHVFQKKSSSLSTPPISKAPILVDFPIISQLTSNDYAKIDGNHIKLTPLGLSLSDYIGTLFISDEVNEKMLSWKSI